MIKARPWLAFLLPLWILKGKLYFKQTIHQYAVPQAKDLPYNVDVINFLTTEKAKGRKVILATASHKPIADDIAEHLGIFDEVLGSENGINLRSSQKKDLLNKLYGEKQYDYFGDSKADIEVFKSARKSYLVNPKRGVERQANAIGNVAHKFEHGSNKLMLFIKQIRVYQWAKNLLIFLPILMAHIIPDFHSATTLVLAFLSFGLVASSVYVLNDLLDLSSDRNHPRKRRRPFASGKLPLPVGFISAPALLLSGFGIALIFLNWHFIAVLGIYYMLTTSYSFYLKRIYIIDIILLASLYTIRLYAGAVAVDVLASPWLLVFSMFIFLSLATVKRYTELLVMIQEKKEKTAGRGYVTSDVPLVYAIGITSGLMSVLVFALYINSKETFSLYHNSQLLYLITPFLLYWVLRIWFKAHRGEMNDDPIVFTAKDIASYVVGAIVFLLVLGATI